MTESFTQGAILAVVLTVLVRLYLSTKSKNAVFLPFSSRDISSLVVELFLVGGIIGAFTLCAVLGSASAWQIFFGYAVVRAIRIGYLLIKS
ncbi:MAG: hypothetical protein K2X77_24700 [Candidatus Obscuribacterales bacterium]|nr:hypothetical protein [Candidatus Obscuribacterales bacterium]